jgi:hypothetical protein
MDVGEGGNMALLRVAVLTAVGYRFDRRIALPRCEPEQPNSSKRDRSGINTK